MWEVEARILVKRGWSNVIQGASATGRRLNIKSNSPYREAYTIQNYLYQT